ncbi:MAG: HAD family phosphatase [Pseudomonadota bacterium]
MPSAILFDLGGVLFHYEPERRWEALAAMTGLSVEDVQKRLSASGYSQACDAGRYRGKRLFDEAYRLLGQRLSRERFVHGWVSAFRPDEAVLEIALRLKEKTPIALFTNNSELVREGLEALWPAVLAPFMPRIFSADIGRMKPDPRAYEQAAVLLGEPAEAILVIDDAPVNTASAAAVGFRTLTFSDAAVLEVELADAGLL